jgi:protein-S-isoprenylcysteine O-methyltransferase Ste14
MQAAAGAAWWVAVFTVPAVRVATLGGLDPVAVAAFDIPLFVAGSALAALGVRVAALVASGWTAVVALGLIGYATVTTEAGWGAVTMVGAATGSLVAAALLWWGRVPTEWVLRGPFAFRPADVGRTARTNLARTFGQMGAFWVFFLAIVPAMIVLVEQRWRVGLQFPPGAAVVGVGVGAAVLLLASTLGIGSAVVMSTLGAGTPLPSAMANRLVIAGPYRWVRNPMAVASILQGVAVGVILSSWLVVVYALAGAVVWDAAIRPHEEADLERRFGNGFRDYRRTVRCWIPRRPAR